MKQYPKTIYAKPTRTIGFIEKDAVYKFTHERNGLYKTTLSNGHDKYESFEPGAPNSGKSAHLWDGVNWHEAGTFIVCNEKGTPITELNFDGTNYYTHNAELELMNTAELYDFIAPYFKDDSNCVGNLALFLSDFFDGYHGTDEKRRQPLRAMLTRETIRNRDKIGSTSDKRAILKLIPKLKRGDELIVYKLDRISRDQAELLAIMSMLDKKGVKLTSQSQQLADGPI